MSDYNAKQIQILNVAETLFAEKGFDGTSIRNIAKAAKINIAMISYYFGSKEKLLETLIIYRTSDLKLQLENISKLTVSPLEKIDSLIELYIDRLNQNREIYRILYTEFSSNKRGLNFKKFTTIKKYNIASLQRIIKDGQEKGVLKKDINVLLIHPTIMGTYFQFYINKPFYEKLLNLKTDKDFDHYINTDLTKHIQQTIKALLII